MHLRYLIPLGALGTLLLTVLALQYAAQRTPTSTGDSGSLAVVRFPQPWTKANTSGSRTVLALPADYEIRKLVSGSTPERLFAVRSPDGSYSQNIYAVSLDGQLVVRPATTQEWDRGDPIQKQQRHILSKSDVNPPQVAVSFGGKQFVKSGKAWGVAVLSPNDDWLALFSHTSEDAPKRSFFSFIGGGEPSKGEVGVCT